MDVARIRARTAGAVTLAAIAVGLIAGPAPALAQGTIPEVTGLSATLDRMTGLLRVHWNAYRSFGAGANPRIDAVVSGGATVGSGTCGTGLPADSTGCEVAAAASAVYQITVTPRTDTDAAIGTTATALTSPLGSVVNLSVSADPTSNVVSVTWDPSTIDWGTGVDPVLHIRVDGAAVDNTCVDPTPMVFTACRFT